MDPAKNPPAVRRIDSAILIFATLGLSWLVMQVVHELGHVVGAWLTDGTVERVVLHPLGISRTDLSINPQPRVVAWAGPVFGVAAPLIGWIVWNFCRLPLAFLARFFAGFCLLANGLYLGIGSFAGVGDAGDIVRHGSPVWSLWLFGIVTAPAGLVLWNGLGTRFGLGKNADEVRPPVAYGAFAVMLLVAMIMAVAS
jgi:hypothetical protein